MSNTRVYVPAVFGERRVRGTPVGERYPGGGDERRHGGSGDNIVVVVHGHQVPRLLTKMSVKGQKNIPTPFLSCPSVPQ